MNNRCYRLVFSKLRGMLVAVAETAIGHSTSHGEAGPSPVLRAITLFAMRHAAFAALALFGFAPVFADAQIVPSGAHAPNVISTANGLPQVNVTKPSGAGVSLNTYSQFDVSQSGAILNNSPVNVNTQLAGQISGNPNFGANDAAKIIVNQVNSNNPSVLRGYVEVAGAKTAAVVIANSSGLVVDGGGFINTSKGILTTGNPLIDSNGNLTGFNVTGGTITVQGAGLNASNIDEVDLLARAVQINAALYANNLNVTTGSNNIDYTSLTPTAIPGSGAAPGVSIDVSQLGGMYANRIVLTSNENGVGVANAGTIAAQAGDLTLTASGQLVQSGTMTATGNVGINAASLANTGTVYAQQNTTIGSTGAVTNSGTLAAQQNTAINAGSLDSTGILGAGVNNDGSLGNSGNLNVSTTGQLNATRENVAGGSATLSGSGVNLAGSETAANGNVSLTANSGDLNLTGATTSAGGALAANAAGTLNNNSGSLTAGSSATLTAGNLSNQNGDISSQGPLVAQASGQIANQGGSMVSQGAMQVSGGAIANNQGTMQSAAGLSVAGASVDNTAGRITSLNGDGLSVTATGAITNAAGTTATGAQGGVIGGNGGVTLQGGTIANHGAVSAQTNLQVTGQSVDNSNGSLGASGNTTVNAGSKLTNNGGSIQAGQTLSESATTLDNSSGTTQGTQVSLTATNLVNHAGTITQTGSGPMSVAVSNSLDNSAGGTIQANSTDLTLASATLDNDGGTITHAGTGKLTIDAGNGSGSASNAGGTIQGNGQVGIEAGAFNNAAGYVVGQTGLTATVGAALNNSNGKLLSNADLSLASGTLNNNGGEVGAASNGTVQSGSMTNSGGSVIAPNLAVTIGSTLDNSNGNIAANQLVINAANLLNHGGTISQYGASPMSVNVSNTLDNSNGGVIQTNSADLSLTPASLDNDGGKIIDAGTGTLTLDAGNGVGAISNANGTIESNGKVVAQGGSFNNAGGLVLGQTGVSATVSGALTNTNGKLLSNTDLSVASGTLNNNGGEVGAASNGTIQSGSMTNSGGSIVAPNLTLSTGSTLDNSSGLIEANQLALGATYLLNRGGTITQYRTGPMAFSVSGTFDNSNGGTLQTNSTDLTLSPATLDNDGGKIIDAGTGTLTFRPGNGTGSLSNVGGQIITAGQLIAQAGGLNNTGGVFAAQGNVAANVTGVLINTQGAIRSLGSLSLASGGALTNTNGQIQSGTGAAGDASTLSVQAASIDNTGGLVSGLGSGNASVNGGARIINRGGVITANGNVAVDTSVLSNTQGGQVSGRSVGIQAGAVDNSNGEIGTFAGSAGDVAIATTGAITNSSGQIGAAHNLTVDASTLNGGGAYSAANDVAISVQGDFTPTSGSAFSAGHDLSFTLPGTFTNNAALQAVDNLDINANDIRNSGAMMAGGTLTTHSTTLENTGAIVGASVSLNATQTISNTGPTALIGATDSNGTLEILAPDIENRDDTTATDTQATTAIYGLGRVVLAGGKNADGSYTNGNLIDNVSALIQSSGDMALYANQVTNTRRVVTTDGSYVEPLDSSSALLAQLGLSLSGCTAVYMAACGPGNPVVSGHDASGNNLVGDPGMIGGAFIDPPHSGSRNSTYQYTTYTGTALANLITGISPQAQIIAGGNLDASNVGTFQNYWSAVAAVGNIAMPATLDQNSWQGQLAPGVQITYTGNYHYRTYDGNYWTYSFCGSGCNAPADIKTFALPSYESTFVAGGTITGTGVNINNTAGNAGIPSLGLVAGQSLGAVTVGSVSGSAGGMTTGAASSIQGSAGGSKAGTSSVSSGSGTVNSVIASATAVNVLSNLTIPQGGLFHRDTAPNAPYLIETNPAFTSAKSFISSDYYLNQLGLSPQNVEKRLGDGLYEQQLVQNQITSLTGKAVLGPYTNTQAMYESLMSAGASLAQSLNLPLGMALSADQVAALTTNVVIMQTEVVDGQSVLVPVVYLAKASQQNMNGPLIAATDIDLQNAQTFQNSGTVQASNTLSIQGQQINNAFGTLSSGGLMSLTTAGNVDLTSATVNAGSLALNAGGNLLLNTATNTVNQVTAAGATRTTTTLGPIANLNVKGDAAIVTGGNFEQNGANLNVGGNLGMSVGGNYDVGTVQTGEQKVVARAGGVSDTNINQATGSSINVGGVSAIGVGGNLTATGANINLGGGGTVVAKGDVTLQAAKTTSTVDSNSATSDHNGNYTDSLHMSTDTLTATTLNAGNSLTVASGHDINVIGSTVNLDKGTATLAATNNVNIGAATATYVDNSTQTGTHNHVVSSKAVESSSNSTTTLAQGSTVSADAVSIASGHDINVAGSTIVGTNDVALSATHDVNITTTQNTQQTSSSYKETRTGLGTSGLTLTVGTNKLATTDQESSVTNNGSVVGSLNGNLSIQAGNTLHVTGSDLVAAQNIAGTAANVIIDSATDTSHTSHTQQTSSSGLTIGLSGSVGDAINGAYAQGQALASGNSNGRAEALHGIAAAGDAAIAGYGAYDIAKNGISNAANAPSIGVQVSVGSSRSQSQSSEDQTTQLGSNVQAGGTAAFVATGNGTAGSGNLTIAGSNVSANDVVLAAKNQVNIVNTTNTDVTQSSNSSSSSSVGVSFGTNGFGVSASMQNAHGDGNSNAAIQNASHVTGANSVTVVSGGDTNIIGSQVNGNQVTAQVGGNLNIQSVQDTTVSTAHQSSSGGGVSISETGGSASFSAQNGHADANYAQVNEQAGINAGSGGFDVNVKGNTNLTGAVISSTADPSQNSLTTGTLTYSDIQNQSHYDATSNGISAGVGVGNTGKAIGPGSVSGTGGVSPMISQNDSGDQSSTTRSAVSAGSINITNQAAQTQDVSGLSRETTNTNGTVSNTPNVSNLLSQQADTMQAAQAAGQVVSQGIGIYADIKEKAAADAVTAAAKNQDLAAGDAASADFDNWKEGGDYRTALHIVGGALIGGLGGGALDAVGGAAGAGVASKLAGQTQAMSDSVAGATGSSLLGNLAGNIAAGLAGAAVGGSAGAAMASNVNLYNQNKNDQEKELEGQVSAGRKVIDALKSAVTGLGSGVGGAAEEEMDIPKVSLNGAVGGMGGVKTAIQQSAFSQLTNLFDKSNPENSLVIDGTNVTATSPGTPGGSNISGTTKVFDSQALTNQQIMDYAQTLAGNSPLVQKAPGVYVATLDDGSTVTLRSVSSSQASTQARFTIDIRGNSNLQSIMPNVKQFEIKFR